MGGWLVLGLMLGGDAADVAGRHPAAQAVLRAEALRAGVIYPYERTPSPTRLVRLAWYTQGLPRVEDARRMMHAPAIRADIGAAEAHQEWLVGQAAMYPPWSPSWVAVWERWREAEEAKETLRLALACQKAIEAGYADPEYFEEMWCGGIPYLVTYREPMASTREYLGRLQDRLGCPAWGAGVLPSPIPPASQWR